MSAVPEDLLSGLDEEQREVVLHVDGPIAVAAGAGSGKTTVLARRVAHLVNHCGIAPARILSLTFSKKAATEMKERVGKYLGRKFALPVTATFHSLCQRILTEEMEGFSELIDPEKAEIRMNGIIAKVCGHQEMDWKRADLEVIQKYMSFAKTRIETSDPESDEAFLLAVDFSKKAADPSRANPQKLWEAFQRIERHRIAAGIFTFDDWLVETARRLQNEDCRLRWAGKFDYILVDENQDTSPIQILICWSLAKDHKNIMMVGDVQQTIYGFRGASPSDFINFPSKWSSKVVKLKNNYRSSHAVVNLGNLLADMAKKENPLHIEMNAKRQEHGCAVAKSYRTQEDEAEAVAEELIASRERGLKWSDHAVLYRTNALVRAIEEACIKKKIPHVVLGGQSFWARKEIVAVLSYLRLAIKKARAEHAVISLSSPYRQLSVAMMDQFKISIEEAIAAARATGTPVTWQNIVSQAADRSSAKPFSREKAMNWAKTIERMQRDVSEGASSFDLVDTVISTKEFKDWISSFGEESIENDKATAIAELSRVAALFKNPADLIEHADTTLEESKKNREEEGDKVTLCSIHRSKGLEWKVVHVITCNNRVIPHIKGDFVEEQRIAYVAFTRARDELKISFVTSAVSKGVLVTLDASPFIPKEIIQVSNEIYGNNYEHSEKTVEEYEGEESEESFSVNESYGGN